MCRRASNISLVGEFVRPEAWLTAGGQATIERSELVACSTNSFKHEMLESDLRDCIDGPLIDVRHHILVDFSLTSFR